MHDTGVKHDATTELESLSEQLLDICRPGDGDEYDAWVRSVKGIATRIFRLGWDKRADG